MWPSMLSCCTKPTDDTITNIDFFIRGRVKITPAGCKFVLRCGKELNSTSELDAGLLRLLAPGRILVRVPAALGCVVYLTYLQVS